MIAIPVARETGRRTVVVDNIPGKDIPMPTTTVSRAATTALVGGVLWALLPVAFGLVTLQETRFGSAEFVAVAASYWLFGVLPPVLLVVGYLRLRDALGTGRAARIGGALAATGLLAMALGNGIEVASMTAGGGEVGLGRHVGSPRSGVRTMRDGTGRRQRRAAPDGAALRCAVRTRG